MSYKPFVRTIVADIDPSELGVTYSHEHLICRPPYWMEKKDDDLILDSIDNTIKDVRDFVALGGNSIVDATAIDYGRDLPALAQIGSETGIHILATAGFNKSFLWQAKLPPHLKKILGEFSTYNEWIETCSEEELAAHVISEVEQGLEGTPYKAGQVKLGTGYNCITPLEEKTFYPIAAAHHATGAPIHCHTEAGTMALEQLQRLTRLGVNPHCVSFGHMDRNLDLYYYEKILEQGAFLCFDGLGKIKYAPESARTAAIMELCRMGYEDQILISHDLARKSYYKGYGCGIGMQFILAKWKPRFIEECHRQGLDGEILMDKFLVGNPQRCFTFSEKKSV